jgi:hypothetical protein
MKKHKLIKPSKLPSYFIIKRPLPEPIDDIKGITYHCLLILLVSKSDNSTSQIILGHRDKCIRDKFAKEHSNKYQTIENLISILHKNKFKEWHDEDFE